jgi:secreted trypsin-like serine protease
MRSAILLLGGSVFGCGEPGPSDLEDTASDQFMIYGGSLPDAPEHDATVAITRFRNPKRNIFCSGTLIAPDVVMTAAHCLDEAFSGAAFNEFEPNDIKVGFGDAAKGVPGLTYLRVEDVEINAGYDRLDLGVNDVGLIRLIDDAEALLGITPVPPLPASLALADPADIGATVNVAGFGQNNTPEPASTKLQTDVTIDDIDTDTFDYLQGSGGPCFGDSGGPAFIDRAGVVYLAGTTSWGSSSCSGPSSFGVSMRVDQFEDFIAGF